MERGQTPPQPALKHVNPPRAATQSFNAMWADMEDRLRRCEQATLGTPRQQQPMQLAAAQKAPDVKRPTAYSDDEYEGSLGETSDYSSGTEA